MRETEVKLRIAGVERTRAALRRFGWRVSRKRHHERNAVYDRRGNVWLTTGRLLRVREAGKRCRLTVKLPIEHQEDYKILEEFEITADDPVQLARILEALDFEPAWQYEKFRTEFRKPRERGNILLDETPIGDYLELEGAPQWIDRTAQRLGFSKEDYVVDTYRSLFVDYINAKDRKPRDMLFGEEGLRGRPGAEK